jgi:hypothetical protein
MQFLRLLFYTLAFVPSALIGQSFSVADFEGGIFLCDKSLVQKEILPDAGLNTSEIGVVPNCGSTPFSETNGVWYRFEIANSGTLAFSLIPSIAEDDLDFVLYRVNGVTYDAGNKVVVRCSRSGSSLGDEVNPISCVGTTGLSNASVLTNNSIGCSSISDLFLAELLVSTGEKYALFVNNFRSSNGFVLDIGGSCSFAPSATVCQPSLSDSKDPSRELRISSVSPNPSTDHVQFVISIDHNTKATLQIVSSTGRLALSEALQLASGDNAFEVPIENLATGLWLLKVTCEGTNQVAKFYKQ